MLFHYQASTKRGKIKNGTLEAESEFEAKKILEEKNLLIIKIRVEQPKRKTSQIFFRRLRTVDTLIFTRNLSVLLKSGLTLTESLDIIADQSSGRIRRLISRISERVKTGVGLAVALEEQKSFPALYVSLIRSGEASGTLEKNLDYLLDQLANEQQLRKQLAAMMVYPAVVLSLSFIIGISMAIFVLPKIATLFVGLNVPLPLPTRILLKIAFIFKNYTWQIVLGIIALVIATPFILRQQFIKPLTSRLILSLPVSASLAKYLNLTRIFQTLGTLLKSGLTIDKSLETVAEVVPNYVYKKELTAIIPQVVRGRELAMALSEKEKYFPKMATRSLAAAEKSGSLEEALFFLAHFYQQEVEGRLKNLSTFLEVGLLLLIGLVVLGLAVSIILPIYQLTGQLSSF